jgi:hypothetical protein
MSSTQGWLRRVLRARKCLKPGLFPPRLPGTAPALRGRALAGGGARCEHGSGLGVALRACARWLGRRCGRVAGLVWVAGAHARVERGRAGRRRGALEHDGGVTRVGDVRTVRCQKKGTAACVRPRGDGGGGTCTKIASRPGTMAGITSGGGAAARAVRRVQSAAARMPGQPQRGEGALPHLGGHGPTCRRR